MKPLTTLCTALLLVGLLGLSTASAQREAIDRVVAQVDEGSILLSDVLREMNLVRMQQGLDRMTEAQQKELFDRVLNDMIDDQLLVAGEASLDGELVVSTDGFVPLPGDVFTIITAGLRSGQFASTTGLSGIEGLAGLDLELAYSPSAVTLTAVGLPGDCDLDGDVDGVDLALIGVNWDPAGTTLTWAQGDFDGNGNIDGADLATLGMNWNPAGTSVPEPTVLGMLAVGTVVLARRRRR